MFFLALVALLLGVAAPASAAGTLAGTTISNQAYANYKDANNNQMAQVFSNTVTTTVSQVAGLEFVPNLRTNAAAPNGSTSFLAQIFNRGNASDTFTFTYSISGDFTPTVNFYYDLVNGGAHVLEPTDPEILPVGGVYSPAPICSIEDDNDVFLKATVPSGVPSGKSATITLTAVSKFDGTKTALGNYTVTVVSAALVVRKTHTPAKPMPGQTVTYTLTITNVGTSDATGAIASDPLPVNLDYVPNSITLNGTTKTDALDADGADFNFRNPNTVAVDVGTIPAGGNAVVTFQTKVKDGVVAESTITNTARVNYLSGGMPVTVDSNGETMFIASLPNVDLVMTKTAANANPGDKVTYPISVTNKGNSQDTINLTVTSTQGLTYTFYLDTNGDGIFDAGDTPLTDSNGDGYIDTGSIPAGTTLPVLAVTTMPAGINDGTIDTTTFTGTSVADPLVKDSVSGTTTVTAPQLALTKSVTPIGNQPPGAILTYTVTVINNGKGPATQVVVSDPIPQHTTYVTGSIKAGTTVGTLAAQTDAADGDNARFDGVSKTVIVGDSTTTLGPNGTLALQFQVRID